MKSPERREHSLFTVRGATSEGESHFIVNGETIRVAKGVNPYAAEILDLCQAVETGAPTRLTHIGRPWKYARHRRITRICRHRSVY